MPISATVTINRRVAATVTLNRGAQGPIGATGEAGPNSVTSATTSNGTANLSVTNLSTDTLKNRTSAGGSVQTSTGTTIASWGAGNGQNFTFASGTGLAFNGTSYTFGSNAASAFRTAVGLGTSDSVLFGNVNAETITPVTLDIPVSSAVELNGTTVLASSAAASAWRTALGAGTIGGSVFQSADIASFWSGIGALSASLSSDATAITSTSFQTVAGMSVTIPAAGRYFLIAGILVSTTGGQAIAFDSPALLAGNARGVFKSGTSSSLEAFFGGSPTLQSNAEAVTGDRPVGVYGGLSFSAGGTFRLRLRLNSAGSLTPKAGTFMTLIPLP